MQLLFYQLLTNLNYNEMKNNNSFFKTLFVLAFMLTSSSGIFAQIYWTGAVTLTDGQTISDNIVLAGHTTVTITSGTAYLSGTISGNFAFIKNGAGSIRLTGNSTATGTSFVIVAGSLYLGNNGTTGSVAASNIVVQSGATLRFARSNDITYSGVISGAGNVTCWGGTTTNKVILTGANTYTGQTYVQYGILQIGDGTSTTASIGSTSDVVVNANRTLRFEPGNSMTFSKDISGAGNVEYLGSLLKSLYLTGNNTYSGTTTIEGTGDLYIGDGGTTGNIAGNVIIQSNGYLNFNRSDEYTFAGNISGAGAVYKYSSGKTILTGANTYTGQTFISVGTLQVGNGISTTATIGSTSNVRVNSTLRFEPGSNMTFSKVISGAGNVQYLGAISKPLYLIGNNTYTGTTTIDGDLYIGNGGTTGNIAGDVIIQSGYLNFSRSDEYTFSKNISGVGVVYKYSSGKTILTGTNTYTGNTYIVGGTLQVGNGTSGSIANTLSVSISSSAILRFEPGENMTFSKVISGAGNVQYLGYSSGTLTFNTAHTYTGGTYIDGTNATLALGASGSIASSDGVVFLSNTAKLSISGNKTIKNLNASNSYTNAEVVLGSNTLTIGTSAASADGGGDFNGIFTGTGGVTKTGTATFAINNNANTATGVFAHNQGEVVLVGTWAGNYNQAAGTALTVSGNPTIGGALTLAGGNINMNLTTATPSKISVTGAVSASGTNTLNITANDINNCVLIQAASGIPNTIPYTVNLPTLYSHLSATGTQLLFSASTQPIMPEITAAALPNGIIGTAYSETLTAVGMAPITWSFEGGSLPAGISIASNGVISGTPTVAGTFTFTVKATNSFGNDAKGFSITVANNVIAPTITTNTLLGGTVGVSYSENLVAEGTSPITWALESGNLPGGLSIAPSGVISGTPTASGTFNFTVKAANSAGSDTKALSITINTIPVIITETLPDGTVETPYSQTLAAEGTTPIIWSLFAGTLPDGLTLAGSGVIAGTPAAEGTFNFTVKAENNFGTDTKALSIKINSNIQPPRIITETLPGSATETPYSQTLAAEGTAPVTWSLESGNLPNGLNLYGSGEISGTPQAAGTFNFTVKATNSAGSDVKGFSIIVVNNVIAPTITTNTLPDGIVGGSYSENLVAEGTSPITWALESGNLPGGLNLYATGEISGTPITNGTFNFAVKATNSAGNDVKNLSISIVTTGIAETEMSNIKVYPNPTKGEIRIQNYKLQEGDYTIFNVAGQAVGLGFKPDHQPNRNSETTIDISHLPAGIYYLKINNDVVKIIKN